MGDAPWAAPSDEELLGRIEATDTDQLRSTAATLTRVANEFDRTSQQVRGLKIAIAGCWHTSPGGSYESFARYTTTLSARLDDTQEALREIATYLHDHAAITDKAQTSIHAAEGLLNAGKYATDQTNNQIETGRMTKSAINDFHHSEQKTRTALWTLGETAPGKIPLPLAMPQPHENWWQTLLFPTHNGEQYWLDGRIDYHQPETVFDPNHPIYGYDEDGHKVPAFEAIPMRRHYDEDGIPLVGIFRTLKLGDEFLDEDDATKALLERILGSYGGRVSHVNKKVKQFFNLNDDAPTDIINRFRGEFLQLITRAATHSDRVFEWSVRSQVTGARIQTQAIFYYDQETRKTIIVQFVRGGKNDGKFVNAFIPNPKQRAAALTAKTIVS